MRMAEENLNAQSEARRAFITTIEDMSSSMVVLQAKKIRAVLKCIAYYDELRAVVDKARSGFDFNAVASEALSQTQNGWTYKCPKSDKQIVALTLAVFVEIDTARLDFVDFISNFFSASDVRKSFDGFCEMMIKPFKFAFLRILDDVERADGAFIASREREIDFVSSGLSKQTAGFIAAIREKVALASLSDDLTKDIVIMLDGLEAALSRCDSLMIKATWAGVKRTLRVLGIAEKETTEVDKLVKMFLLTDTGA